jgi:hypothetical protein
MKKRNLPQRLLTLFLSFILILIASVFAAQGISVLAAENFSYEVTATENDNNTVSLAFDISNFPSGTYALDVFVDYDAKCTYAAGNYELAEGLADCGVLNNTNYPNRNLKIAAVYDEASEGGSPINTKGNVLTVEFDADSENPADFYTFTVWFGIYDGSWSVVETTERQTVSTVLTSNGFSCETTATKNDDNTVSLVFDISNFSSGTYALDVFIDYDAKCTYAAGNYELAEGLADCGVLNNTNYPNRNLMIAAVYDEASEGGSPIDTKGNVLTVEFDADSENPAEFYTFMVWFGIYDDSWSLVETTEKQTVSTAPIVDVTSISLDQTSATLKTGETLTLEATIKPEDATSEHLTWTSSDPAVATVVGGVVTAKNSGTTTIRATAPNDLEIYAECEVTVTAAVDSVTFPAAALPASALWAGETFDLTAPVVSGHDVGAYNLPIYTEVVDQSGSYISSDESVLTVAAADENDPSKGAVVTALAPGAAFVTFTSNDGGHTDQVLYAVLDPAEASADAASYDGTPYATIALAVSAARADGGGTVTLLKDQEASITLYNNCSLDLGGHMLYTGRISIPANAAVPYIGNGFLVCSVYGQTNTAASDTVILLHANSTLELLGGLTVLYAGGELSSSGNIVYVPSSACVDAVENCDIDARWAGGRPESVNATDAPSVFYVYGGMIQSIANCNIKSDYSLVQTHNVSSSSVAIYSGTYESYYQRTGNAGAGRLMLYGGTYNAVYRLGTLPSGYSRKDLGGGWWEVVEEGLPGTLTLTVEPSDAVLALNRVAIGGARTSVTPTNSANGTYEFAVECKYEYEYEVSADGYVTKTGSVPISFTENFLTVSLNAIDAPDAGTRSVKGGDYITEGGAYRLEQPDQNVPYGVVTVTTREPVELVGYGITDAAALFKDLTIDCGSGVDLTLNGIWANNNAGQGTASGAVNMGVNILNFKGSGNALYVKGVNLLENQDYVQGAGIHVPKGVELTFREDPEAGGILYLYKYSAGAGIGGNSNEACGKLTFESGTYLIKGSKTGAVIGGDIGGKTAKNDDITVDGAEVLVLSMATGDCIGTSNGGTCGGNVYLKSGRLTTISEWAGSGISGGNLYVTGGMFRPMVTQNIVKNSNIADWAYVSDAKIAATKLNGEDKTAYRLIFDTAQLSEPATDFKVSGADGFTYEGGLFNYTYQRASTVTVENFIPSADKNLYLYLPADTKTLTVNDEEFILTWTGLPLVGSCFTIEPAADPGTGEPEPGEAGSGDLLGTGRATVADALFAAGSVLGVSSLSPAQIAAADVDNDGKITMKDVILIARLAAA